MKKFWICCVLIVCLTVAPMTFASESPATSSLDDVVNIVVEWVEAAVEALLSEETNIEDDDGLPAAMGGVLVPVG